MYNAQGFNVQLLEEKNVSLFEAASREKREWAVCSMLAPLRAEERLMLVGDPIEVGFRADAILAGVPLDDDDGDSVTRDADAKTFAQIVPPILLKRGYGRLRAV